MPSTLVLLVLGIQGVLGTFPPVSNPPPIPGQAFRTLDIAPQQYYIQEDLNQGPPPQDNVRDGQFPSNSLNDQRWYIKESQPAESSENPSSIDTFDRYYPNGDPAIGPVATPLPDDTYVAQPSSISKVNPDDGTNSGSSNIWILSRGADNQYAPEGWIQVPTERVIEVVKDSGPPLPTDVAGTIIAPLSGVQGKTQISPLAPPSILQQIFVRAPNVVGSQKVLSNPPTIVQEVPSVKQIVDIPQQNFKQVVQRQIAKDSHPFLPPAPLNPVPPSLPVKTSFTVPPPPPPPIKGGEIVSPKVVSSIPVNPASGQNVLLTSKNGVLQQLRHLWVPTSSRTGRFVTIPVSSVNLGKSVINKGAPLESTPISVSDTWVLNTDGSILSFEQKNSLAASSVVQSGKVVLQGSDIIQINPQPITEVVSNVDSSKNPPFVGNINFPSDIWPVRSDYTSSKILGKTLASVPALPVPPSKSSGLVVAKSIEPAPLPVAIQKSVIGNTKLYPPPNQVTSPVFRIVSGKPYPIATQKSLFPPENTIILQAPVSGVIGPQNKQPLTRIVRVNRFPIGSYYLLNARVRPNIVAYPNPNVIQQPKVGVFQVIQTNQFPLAVQKQQSAVPIQPKQFAIPLQQQVISSKMPSRVVTYSLPLRQIIAPLPPQKSPNPLIYPAMQAMRYAYPLNGYLKSNPIITPTIGTIIPQPSPLKVTTLKSSSFSTSSENSSSEESEEKPKKEAESTESEESKEKEKEPEKKTEGESEELKKESTEESKAEPQYKESMEPAESQLYSQILQITTPVLPVLMVEK